VVVVHAPVEGREDDSEEFYDLLGKILETTPKSGLILVMGDLSARMSNNKITPYVGKHEENVCNRNEERLVDFVVYNQLNITCT
jgi:hypothetical protein